MIPAIFALLSLTLGDGHYKNGFFEHDDPIKIIKHHVVEESWEKEAIELTKGHIKTMHNLKHQGSQSYHQLIKASRARVSNETQIDSLIHRIIQIEHEQNDNWIDSRFDLSRKMASEEFYKIMESAKTLDKIRSENEKAKVASKIKRSLYFQVLDQSITEYIEDLNRKEKVLSKLKSFKSEALTALDSIDVIKYERDPRLDNHHATKSELTNFSNSVLDYDKDILEDYLSFHDLLSKNTTDKEWHQIEKKISKAIGK